MYDGYVFFCDESSLQQCISNKRYTCVGEKAKPEELKEGSVVFLYNSVDKSLLGPFTTLSEGDELDAGTWVENEEHQYPYDDIKVTWEDLHVLQNAPEKLPFLNDPKTCKLSTGQIQRTLDLLRQEPLYLYAKN
ncbi:MAG TPA: hypothetical protein VLV84_01260, partial [Candidatus Acidoferrales bacterium]|nr:hypothetical protein [Candidatus Acidoferrales bacterium]